MNTQITKKLQKTKMELVTTYICKTSDIGVHSNMFGGVILGLVDQSSGAYAAQICDTPKMVTIKIDELIFKNPVKEGNIIKMYAMVKEFGVTSVTLYIEVRKHNVYTGVQDVVLHTNIKFVRIDEEGHPIPISERVKKRYAERMGKYGKGLLSQEEKVLEQTTVLN
jgi:acyl-CoA thioesterase YciA